MARLILVLCPALLTLVQYGVVPRVDPGVLALSDDALFMNRVREPLTLGTLFLIYGEHLMPTTYLYYRLIYALVGTSWPLYGWLLVAGHSLVCTAVGLTIWKFGRSLVAALAITVPLTVSFSFAAGPLSYFINMQHYLMYLSYLVVVLLLHRFLTTGSAFVYALMMALSVFCVLLTTPAVFLLPIIVIYYVAFRLLTWPSGRCSRPMGRFASIRARLGRRDQAVACGVVGLVGLFATMLAISVIGFSNRLPGQAVLGPPTPEPPLVRTLKAFEYGFIGLLPFGGFRWMPGVMESWVFVTVVGILIAGLILFFVVQLWAPPSAERRDARTASIVALASLVVAMVYPVMVVAGREYLQYSHFRYNGPSVIYSSIAMGLALSVGFGRLHGMLRGLAVLAVLGASLGLAYANARSVARMADYRVRDEPRYVWRQVGEASWTLGGTASVIELGNGTAVHVSHQGRQSVESATPTVLRFDLERHDRDNLHEPALSSRLTCRTAGRYLLIGQLAFAQGGSGTRHAAIVVNGSRVVAEGEAPGASGGPTTMAVGAVYELAAGDYVELRVTQTTGERLDVESYPEYSPELMMVRLADGAGVPTGLTPAEVDWENLGLAAVARVSVDPNQMVADDVFTTLSLRAETLDPASFELVTAHIDRRADELFLENGADTSRLVAKTAGRYLVVGELILESRRAGFRRAGLSLNGTRPIVSQTVADEGTARIPLVTVKDLAPGDALELYTTSHQR